MFQGRHDWYRSEHLQALHQAIAQADGAGRTAAFHVRQVLAWQLSRKGIAVDFVDREERAGGQPLLWFERQSDSRALAQCVHEILRTPEPKQTILWWQHAGRLLGIGPLCDQIAELLAPHHELGKPMPLLRWKDAIDAWNPWRTGDRGGVQESERWASLKAAASQELGLSIESTVTEWRARVMAERGARPRFPARLADAEEAKRAQEALATLAARSWRFDDWYRAWPLRLDTASRAPLAILPGHGEREGLHVVANLGAGRLLRIQVVRFPGEEPTEIVQCDGNVQMDGGDVHLWFEELSDATLEGSALPARERRRRDDD